MNVYGAAGGIESVLKIRDTTLIAEYLKINRK